jgi:hypothetical protein
MSGITQEEFLSWLRTAATGEKIKYHIGKHIVGSKTGRTAMDAYDDGKVILFQKREGTQYGYWAQKRNV